MKVVCREAKSIGDFADAIRLRVDVFIIEQRRKPGWEPDEEDRHAMQFVALVRNKVVATARVKRLGKGVFKIGRMATAKKFRGSGVGRSLLKFVLARLRKLKPKKIWLCSQVHAQGFYEKNGFKATGKPFKWSGMPHVNMRYTRLTSRKNRPSF